MFQHRIEHRQQLAHAGGECHFLRFPGVLQPLIEDSDHRIEPGGDNGPHIQNRANLRAATPHRPSPSECSAIAIQWGHANERGDLLIRQRAEFRETR